MNEINIEITYLEDIKRGNKTIEGRLNRGKYANYKPLDLICFQSSAHNKETSLTKNADSVKVKILKIENFKSFEEMLKKVGYKKAIPRAKTFKEALSVYRGFYSLKEEKQFGVLAIYIDLIG